MVQAALENLSYLSETDAEIAKLIGAEQQRQENTLELIASENHVSPAVLEAVGSCLTNKYCEGYPGKRYYSGCGNYDEIEALAIGRARKLFGCNYANVQSHSGANANLAVFFALLEPGDVFASIELSDGGHLTHGSPVNLSGKWFKPVPYPLIYDESQPNYGHIDFAYDIFNENEDLKFHSDSLMEFFNTSFCSENRSFLQKIKFGLKCQIEKLLYLTLVARKTNGLRNDSDRSWPFR